MKSRIRLPCWSKDRAAASVKPAARAGRVLVGLLDDLCDRARLVMNEAPAVVDAPEMVGGGKRRPADDLDAEHARTVAVDDHLRLGTDDLRPLRILQDIAPASDHGGAPDDGWPARMDAGDRVVIRPHPFHAGKVAG